MSGAALKPGTVVQGYRVVRVLGVGGFGVVYEGFHPELDRRRAMKEFFPAAMARRAPAPDGRTVIPTHPDWFATALEKFVDTATRLSRLDHPNIVRVDGFERKFDTAYMIMELIDGYTLGRWRAATREVVDEASARRLMQPVMDAVAYMHREGVFHGDLSPDNIMLRSEQVGHAPDSTATPVLIDFETLKQVVRPDATRALSAVVYNPAFSAPERTEENPTSGHTREAEVYSLAAILYFLASGSAPAAALDRARALSFGEPDLQRPLAQAIARREAASGPNAATVSRPPGFSPRFLEAVDAGLSLRRNDRPVDVPTFLERLGWMGPPLEAGRGGVQSAVGVRPAAAGGAQAAATTTAPDLRTARRPSEPVVEPAARRGGGSAALLGAVAVAGAVAIGLGYWLSSAPAEDVDARADAGVEDAITDAGGALDGDATDGSTDDAAQLLAGGGDVGGEGPAVQRGGAPRGGQGDADGGGSTGGLEFADLSETDGDGSGAPQTGVDGAPSLADAREATVEAIHSLDDAVRSLPNETDRETLSAQLLEAELLTEFAINENHDGPAYFRRLTLGFADLLRENVADHLERFQADDGRGDPSRPCAPDVLELDADGAADEYAVLQSVMSNLRELSTRLDATLARFSDPQTDFAGLRTLAMREHARALLDYVDDADCVDTEYFGFAVDALRIRVDDLQAASPG